MEEEDFEAAVNFVKQMGCAAGLQRRSYKAVACSPELELSQTDMLRFYALFKQAPPIRVRECLAA